MKKISYDEIVKRLTFFREQKQMKSGDVSERMGYGAEFLKEIANGRELKMSALLEFCEVMGIDIYDFIYLGDKYTEENSKVLHMFGELDDEKQLLVLELMNHIKKSN